MTTNVLTAPETALTAPETAKKMIHDLVKKAHDEKDFRCFLEASLKQAQEIACKKLDPALYDALEYWPTDLEGYAEYLEWFCKWIPDQEDHPGWKDPGKYSTDYREPFDRLCHFYWLVDQPVDGKKIIQDDPWFSHWLIEFAQAWGEFLDTPDSFNDGVLQSFIKRAPKYRVKDSMFGDPLRPNNPSGWQTFNQFFARELNPGLRPIAEPLNNAVVTCPADCTYKNDFPITADSLIDEINVKGTHRYASVRELLGDSKYANAFGGGHFAHYFLGPYSYHRFHTPVAGRVEECFKIHGKVFLDVVLKQDGQFDAPDSAQGGYEFGQARGVVTIDTSGSPYGDVGVVAVIPIGMAQVSSVNMFHATGTRCQKGDEFGYFMFGGSDIIVLFQEGVNPQVSKGGYYRHYGTTIAQCSQLSR